MPATHIADPVRPDFAGISKVRSDGTVAARREAGLIVASGNTDIPSYVVSFSVAPVAAMDIFNYFSGGGKVLRLRRIVLVNPGSATAAAVVDLQLGYAPALGSGGTSPNGLAVDAQARVAGVTGGPDPIPALATLHVGDTTVAAGLTALYNPLATVAVPAAAAGFTPLVIYDARDERFKPVTVSNNLAGIILRIAAVGAGATGFRGYAEFTLDDA